MASVEQRRKDRQPPLFDQWVDDIERRRIPADDGNPDRQRELEDVEGEGEGDGDEDRDGDGDVVIAGVGVIRGVGTIVGWGAGSTTAPVLGTRSKQAREQRLAVQVLVTFQRYVSGSAKFISRNGMRTLSDALPGRLNWSRAISLSRLRV